MWHSEKKAIMNSSKEDSLRNQVETLSGLLRVSENKMEELEHTLAQQDRLLAESEDARHELEREVDINRRLAHAAIVETRDLCLPEVTKSLLYATVDVLKDAALQGPLPDSSRRVWKKTIETLERMDRNGVFTAREEAEQKEARRQSKVVVRFGDIMLPRTMVEEHLLADYIQLHAHLNPRVVKPHKDKMSSQRRLLSNSALNGQ